MEASIKSGWRSRPLRNLGTNSILVMALLLLAVSQAMADEPRDRAFNSSFVRDSGNNAWRLGEHNQIYHRTDRGWRRVQGSAIDVADGWVIGTDRRSGGYGVYRWNGYRFERMPGGGVEIGGTYEHPWVINNRGERFEWNGRDWREVRAYGRIDGDRHEENRRERRRPDW